MPTKPSIAKAIAMHLAKHAAAATPEPGDVVPDFASLIAKGASTSNSNACKIAVALTPQKGMPDIGRACKLTDAAGGVHYLTFVESDATAATAPGTYTLEWMATGIPGTTFTVEVTGDLATETHRPGKIPSMGFTGTSFAIEAVET